MTYEPGPPSFCSLNDERGPYWSPMPIEAAYLAGIIDGEGTIGIYDLPGNGFEYHLRLVISNTSDELADWVHRRIGGSRRTQIHKNPRYRPSHQITLVHYRAANVIRICLPYLVVKREHALIALEFMDGLVNCRGRVVPEAEILRRRTLAERITALNQRPGWDGVKGQRTGRRRRRTC